MVGQDHQVAGQAGVDTVRQLNLSMTWTKRMSGHVVKVADHLSGKVRMLALLLNLGVLWKKIHPQCNMMLIPSHHHQVLVSDIVNLHMCINWKIFHSYFFPSLWYQTYIICAPIRIADFILMLDKCSCQGGMCLLPLDR